MSGARELLIRITPADCLMDVFRSGGRGGQHQNTRNTGVRFRHLPSGAVGEARDHKSQMANKRAAWRRMAETPEMQLWLKLRAGEASLTAAEKRDLELRIARNVEQAMQPENLVVEIKDADGRWARSEDL